MNMDLMCAESICGDRMDNNFAQIDENLTRDPRVIDNLLTLERLTMPEINYFAELQNDLMPFMRKVVTTWMLEVCEEQLCEEQVFPLAVNYLDRFLCVCPISRQQLQLLGATSLLMSSKIRQCHALTVHLLCAYTDHSVSPDEMRHWEILMLTKLNWNVSGITGFDYVDHLLERVPWGKENPLTRRHAHTLVSVCYTEPEFMQTAPSLLAAACVCAAARGLNQRSSGRSLSDLCALTRSNLATAELMVCHIERVVATETAALQQAARPAAPQTPTPAQPAAPQQAQPNATQQPAGKDGAVRQGAGTPTDVQDVHF